MTRTPRRVLIVGESVAGVTAARELRGRGYDGELVLIGDDPHGSYSRPALSKSVLKDPDPALATTLTYDDLNMVVVRSAAVGLDVTGRSVTTRDGRVHPFDAVVIATGATPRRLAGPSQQGELVIRTLDDALAVRRRLDLATSAVVVGAGFLGMEVASAAVRTGVDVTVVDVRAPLEAVLGPYLSGHAARLASARGVKLRQVAGPVTLVGNPVHGVSLSGRETLVADLVVSCAGDVPATDWLAGTGLADRCGIPVDDRCATTVPGIFAAGDVCYLGSDGTDSLREPARRQPFWYNAVAQGKVAAASVLGQLATTAPSDDYFWTELFGVQVKVAGPLPLVGTPDEVEGSIEDHDALLTWQHADGRATVVAFGRRIAVGRLKALASERAFIPTEAKAGVT